MAGKKGEYVGQAVCVQSHDSRQVIAGNVYDLYRVLGDDSLWWVDNPEAPERLNNGQGFYKCRFRSPAIPGTMSAPTAKKAPALPPECWIDKDQRNAGVDFSAITRLVAEAKPGVK